MTCKDSAEAAAIAQTVVAERLAACGNVIDGMTSCYRWQGEVVSDRETVLILKTVADGVDRLTRRVVDLHSYEVPCVVVLPLAGGHEAYLNWISENVEL